MALEIIPSIELSKGQAVRIKGNDFDVAAKIAEDPVRVARKLVDAGATRLQILDQDGAKVGQPRNLSVIKDVARRLPIPVQIGGGLRDLEIIRNVMQAVPNADRILIECGVAAADDALMLQLLRSWPDKIIVGVDVAGGYVVVQSWTARPHETAAEFGKRLATMGARRFLYTTVSRDGAPQNLDVAGTRAFADAVGVSVLAAGDIQGPEALENLAAASQPNGITGVIIDKALHAGRVTLADAQRIAAAA